MAKTHEMNPETWLDEHGDYLFRYARTRLNNQATAEDVVQETFLAAMKAKERFDGRAPVRYWLLGILKHKIVDHIRKAVRETVVEDVEAPEIQNSAWYKAFGVPAEKPQPWHFNPRKAFEQKEFFGVLACCMAGLKGPPQRAFALRELEGRPTEEICKDLGITPNNLWVILHRARTQLKECLEEQWTKQHQETEQ